MEESTLSELRELLDEVIHAPSKKDAKPPLRRLEFAASIVSRDIDPYLSGKLFEAIGYAETASGRVQNKQHWISCAEDTWIWFEARVRKEPSH
jgi:hypothetical protein